MYSINVNGCGERDCKAPVHHIHGRRNKETSHVCRKPQSICNSSVIFLKIVNVCVLKGSAD